MDAGKGWGESLKAGPNLSAIVYVLRPSTEVVRTASTPSGLPSFLPTKLVTTVVFVDPIRMRQGRVGGCCRSGGGGGGEDGQAEGKGQR